jgi:hypothetical protein
MRGEPRAGVLNRAQALEQEPRPHQQNETQRYLRDDEAPAQYRSPASAHHPARFRLQRGDQVDLAALQRGYQPEKNSRDQANARAHDEHAPIDLTWQPHRDATSRREQQRQQVATPVCDQEPTRRRDCRQDQPLREQLFQQPSAAGADR